MFQQETTGVILAGGRGRRMDGQDKGLLRLDGRPLAAHLIDALLPQVGALIINANRNLSSYRTFGYPVVEDAPGGFLGPLAGIAGAMAAADTPYLLAAPCDSPLAPPDLCARLHRASATADADIGIAHDGNRIQPAFALLRRTLLPDLLEYLAHGGRRLDAWQQAQRWVAVDFSDRPEAFFNINRPEDLTALESTIRKARQTPGPTR